MIGLGIIQASEGSSKHLISFTYKLRTFNEDIMSGMVPYNCFLVRKLYD